MPDENIQTAEQLHDLSIESVNAYYTETDEAKKGELKTVSDGAIAKAKEAYKAEGKTFTDKAVSDAVAEATKKTVPEKYEINLPENSPLQPDAIDKVSKFAKEKNLSNEEAQLVLNSRSEAVSDFMTEQNEKIEENSKEMLKLSERDPEIGGDNFSKNSEIARRVISRFGSDKLKTALNETGLGNHPELLRLMTKIGNSMSEDQLVIPGAQPPEKKIKSPAEVLYGGDSNK